MFRDLCDSVQCVPHSMEIQGNLENSREMENTMIRSHPRFSREIQLSNRKSDVFNCFRVIF